VPGPVPARPAALSPAAHHLMGRRPALPGHRRRRAAMAVHPRHDHQGRAPRVPAVALRRRSRTTPKPSVITLRNRRSLTAPARITAAMRSRRCSTGTPLRRADRVDLRGGTEGAAGRPALRPVMQPPTHGPPMVRRAWRPRHPRWNGDRLFWPHLSTEECSMALSSSPSRRSCSWLAGGYPPPSAPGRSRMPGRTAPRPPSAGTGSR
jgi:hypothetical protein